MEPHLSAPYRKANRSCVMNKCAASAFQAAGIIYGLRLLRAAYCDEQMGAAHKAIVTADMDRAMDERIYRDSGRTYCNKRTFFNARDSSTPSTAEQTPRGITRKAGV